MALRLCLPLLLLTGCAPNTFVEGTFRGEEITLASWTMFHWTDGLTDDESNDLDVDRLAVSFSETEDLCDRQKTFLETASDTEVPNPVTGAEHDEHADLFEEHFPVQDNWDITFWIGLPNGSEGISDADVSIAPAFDDTYLNAEGAASRWDQTPPGDLLTWRSDRWYGEYGQPWEAVSGTVHIDQFIPGDGVRGSIDAVFVDEQGEEADIAITFQIGECFDQ